LSLNPFFLLVSLSYPYPLNPVLILSLYPFLILFFLTLFWVGLYYTFMYNKALMLNLLLLTTILLIYSTTMGSF
ncbi:hypothetical protein BY996DRAFT_8302473, partial [Phakopsora pachyrhizi]